MTNNENRRDGRGFAGMDPDKQRAGSKGGKATHSSSAISGPSSKNEDMGDEGFTDD